LRVLRTIDDVEEVSAHGSLELAKYPEIAVFSGSHFSAAFRSFAQVAARLLHTHPISKAEPTTCKSI
jgi:hypothetical protein